MTDWIDALPERMRDLPMDHRRKVPVPWMNEEPDGTPNFITINLETTVECGNEHVCGICGKRLEYWIAFVGGPLSFKNGVYTDPPFHRECARAAMTLCPHIARKVHRRSSEDKMPEGSFKSEGAVEEKPDEWIIGVVRDFEMVPWGRGVLFVTGTRKWSDHYRYDEHGNLQEVDG